MLSIGEGTVRALRPQERASGVRAVQQWAGVAGSLADTYPQVFRDARGAELVGLFRDERLVAHAATQDVRVRTFGCQVRVLLVGSVATAPDQRGQGFATAVLRHVVETAQQRGHDAVLLWSSDWTFYRRLGFVPAGRQWEVGLHLRRGAVPPGVREARDADLPAILALHRAKPIGVERDHDALAVLLSATPMRTFVLERAGVVVAYACLGKGADFGGWWHEVGGADHEVAALVRGAGALLESRETTLLVPPYRRTVQDLLGDSVLSAREGAAALCKPLTERGTEELFVDGLDSI